MNGINPWLQTHWDWRAAGNFIGGGSGTGLLLVTAAALPWSGPDARLIVPALVLITVGLSLVWMELGRPWRFLNVFFNPRTSWMTRESLVAVPLLLFGLAAALTASPTLLWAAALTGMVFLYCQGRILIAAKGIPAWRAPSIMGLVVTTGLAEGAGLYLLAAPWLAAGADAAPWALMLLLLLTAARLAAWRVYRKRLQDNAPWAALAVLQESNARFVLIGHVLPWLAILAAWPFAGARPVLAVLAGAGALLGGWFIKIVIVTRAAYNQGYAVEHTPARGGGKAGPGIKPGWK